MDSLEPSSSPSAASILSEGGCRNSPCSKPLCPPSWSFLVLLGACSFALDRVTKVWANDALIEGPQDVCSCFTLFLTKNKGGAWGILYDVRESIRLPFFLVVSVASLLFLLRLYRQLQASQRCLFWGIPMVVGGALGNLYDRLVYGSVTDFLDFFVTWHGAVYHWPTFNTADISICVGVGLMVLGSLSDPSSPPTPSASAS